MSELKNENKELKVSPAKRILVTLVSLLLLAALVAADQVTKQLIQANIPAGGQIPVLEPLLYFTHVENTGAAWSMLSGKQIFFIVLTIVMLLVIAYAFIKTPITRKYAPIRYILIVLSAGAIGNLIDRIMYGKVTDFIDSRLIYCLTNAITGNGYNFPIYNFADICVTLSMATLVILIIFKYKENDFSYLLFKKRNNNNNPTTSDNNEPTASDDTKNTSSAEIYVVKSRFKKTLEASSSDESASEESASDISASEEPQSEDEKNLSASEGEFNHES